MDQRDRSKKDGAQSKMHVCMHNNEELLWKVEIRGVSVGQWFPPELPGNGILPGVVVPLQAGTFHYVTPNRTRERTLLQRKRNKSVNPNWETRQQINGRVEGKSMSVCNHRNAKKSAASKEVDGPE